MGAGAHVGAVCWMKLSDLAKEIFKEDRVDCDATTQSLGKLVDHGVSFELVAKQPGVFSGKAWLEAVAELSSVRFRNLASEGARLSHGDVIADGTALASELLAVERSLLNVLQQLCGVATKTARIVDRVQAAASAKEIPAELRPKVFHTRKTLPLLRDLQIEAVLAGGAELHRRDLSSRLLFKDNHKQLILDSGLTYGNYLKSRLSENDWATALFEVDTLDEALELHNLGARHLLLDNFSPEQVADAVARLPGATLEVSGGLHEGNVEAYVIPGVHRLSLGCLTHSVPALDISLKFMHGLESRHLTLPEVYSRF